MMKSLIAVTLSLFTLVSASPVLSKRADPVCPADGYLPADQSEWLFPVYIVPVSKNNPDTKYGTVYSPKITPNDFCTIFNLYVPESAAGKTCTLKFFFPSQDQLRTSSYTYSGAGHFTFTGYAFGSGATADTTWNNQPPAGPSPPSPPAVLEPGNAYVINAGDCGVQAGQGSLEVSGMLCSSDTTFEYFQDSDLCPIGFYVVIS
ncbi:putative gpi anchored cell wall protein [Neofusicoccum parvum]|uniref:Gpi anchored cell wall protein n=1 Tax=Neofusicoccum parvum TaxID=310453 RepID=A0ACB5SAK5_9PEZI|nr:putative gpi anchored cell wall protein [Neofusicoccum parvum]